MRHWSPSALTGGAEGAIRLQDQSAHALVRVGSAAMPAPFAFAALKTTRRQLIAPLSQALVWLLLNALPHTCLISRRTALQLRRNERIHLLRATSRFYSPAQDGKLKRSYSLGCGRISACICSFALCSVQSRACMYGRPLRDTVERVLCPNNFH